MKSSSLIMVLILLSLSLMAQKNGYSPWSSDTTSGFEGRYIVSNTRMKNVRNTSVNKIQTITTYYDACNQAVERTKYFFVGSVAPRLVRLRQKTWRKNCEKDSSDFGSFLLENDSVKFRFSSDTLITHTVYSDSLRFIIQSLYGAELLKGYFTEARPDCLLEPSFFPWKGQFVITVYLPNRLIYRDVFTKN